MVTYVFIGLIAIMFALNAWAQAVGYHDIWLAYGNGAQALLLVALIGLSLV